MMKTAMWKERFCNIKISWQTLKSRIQSFIATCKKQTSSFYTFKSPQTMTPDPRTLMVIALCLQCYDGCV